MTTVERISTVTVDTRVALYTAPAPRIQRQPDRSLTHISRWPCLLIAGACRRADSLVLATVDLAR